MKFVENLSLWCYKVIDTRVMLAGVLIFVLFMIFVLPRVSAGSEAAGLEESPDTSFLYTSRDLYRMAENYGEEGRAYYIRTRFTFDVIWPLVYLLFLAGTLTAVLRSFPSPLGQKANVLPFFGVFFDFLENSGAALVMYRYPQSTPVIAEITPVFTFLKWFFLGASFLVLVLALLPLVIRRFEKPYTRV
jgi:hypothetical protein